MLLFKKKKKSMALLESRNMLLTEKSPFVISEAYKAMRTNLMYTKTEGTCKRLAFTSALTGEGKSTNCSNTAITVAQMGKRVLLIDADMRRPRCHRLFGKPLSPGLSELLAGIHEEPVIHDTPHANMKMMTAGCIPPNPAELLSDKRMPLLLEQLSEQFDYIFIDMPPLNLVTDAAVMTDMVDGYIMVVRAETTPVENVKEAVLTLEQVNAKIVGFLLNGVVKSGKGYYKKGYYKSGYYLDEHNSPSLRTQDEDEEGAAEKG